MLQSSEPEGLLEQADSGTSAPGMHQRSADEESGDLHTGPSSRRVSVSSEPAFPDRGEHVQSDTSTSFSPCGWISVAATTGYRCSLPACYQACSTAGTDADQRDGAGGFGTQVSEPR